MWIINWLVDRWDRLVYLLEDFWEEVEDLIDKGVPWITAIVEIARSRAFSYAKTLYNNAVNNIEITKNWIMAQVNSIDNAVRSWTDNLVKATKANLKSLIESAKATLQRGIDLVNVGLGSVRSWAEKTFGSVWGRFQSFWSEITAWAAAQINTATAFLQASMEQIRAALLNDILSVRVIVNDFINTWLPLLLAFFNNPAKVIFAIIEATFYRWAEWYFGVLLWDTNVQPPRKPDLFGDTSWMTGSIPGGGGGTGDEWVIPTPGWFVSGYRFTLDHPGIDLGINQGDPVKSVRAGFVQRIANDITGYGLYVRINHKSGYSSLYGHLLTVQVIEGQQVNAGQVIALGNSSGNSTGPHLHLEIRKDGTPVNPESLFNR